MITAILISDSKLGSTGQELHYIFQSNQITAGVPASILNRTLQLSDSGSSTLYLYTINKIEPNQLDGNFNILGSLCTSITDLTDTTDSGALAELNSILIFDGCIPCNTCKIIAWLQSQLQRCQMILNGMKDCQLYTEDAAQALWQAMDAQRVQPTLQDSCQRKDNIISLDRKAAYGQAIRLLYQYKAVVAMWNYVVRCKSWVVKIEPAPQDYAGFVVQTKRTIDTCGMRNYRPSVDIKIQLQDGQTLQWLQQAAFGMGIYADIVQENTYISLNMDPSSVNVNTQSSVTSRVEISSDSGYQAVNIHVDFNPSAAAYVIASAAVKILPTTYRPGAQITIINQYGQEQTYTAPQDIFSQFTLQDWVKYRVGATTISEALQTKRNIWKVDINWSLPIQQNAVSRQPQPLQGDSRVQRFATHRYYLTAYAKYPGQEESDSISQE